MHPSRRRKKRPNYGLRTVQVLRGSNGFGFTISGQQPCILSCIVNNSPADQAGLRAGDFLISVNGVSVSKNTHDAVVSLIANCVGPIKMTIAENYYSDSSDEELKCGRMLNRKPKYIHKLRGRSHKADLHRSTVEKNEKNMLKMRNCASKRTANELRNVFIEETLDTSLNISDSIPTEDEAGPVEYKALVRYLGTVEMPELVPSSSMLQTVCSCIRKLRQERRRPTAVLMTILPTCLTLKNSSNNILAIYPTNRVIYVGSSTDRESRYFGLVTSASCSSRYYEGLEKRYGANIWQPVEKKFNNLDCGLDILNSCHVFVTDSKLVDHNKHFRKAESFKITCTPDTVTGNCLEFPCSALYIVSLLQNMYKLQNNDKISETFGPLVANSPQPSASSNSDSGIGFRDDCGNISDRILVVEFPMHHHLPILNKSNRPAGIDASDIPLMGLDLPLNNDHVHFFDINNLHQTNLVLDQRNNLSGEYINGNIRQLKNLNNIRALEEVHIKHRLEKSEPKCDYLIKQNNDIEPYGEYIASYNRLTCRAFPDVKLNRGLSPYGNMHTSEIDTDQIYNERPVDVQCSNLGSTSIKKSIENVSLHSMTDDIDFKFAADNVSMNSSKSLDFTNLINIFKVPFENKKVKKQSKVVSSCANLEKYNENIMNYKLSPKVYGLSKPKYNCEELNNLDTVEKFGFSSLQNLCSWDEHRTDIKNFAISEPDVRVNRSIGDNLCDQNGVAKCNSSDGPHAWAYSFEKLLEDPLGLHTFAEFLKKEFSAENIYFWTACERFRNLACNGERTAEAQRIYEQHLSAGAPEAVNVDSQGRQCSEQFLQEPDSNIFDQAQKQIFNLMKFDSYPRFLKSEIYKRCLSGEIETFPIDTRLLLHQSLTTPSKLKKSVSNAEDSRRKSLLPWHRKNRSKSKDRGEIEYNQKINDVTPNSENFENQLGKDDRKEIHSSGSSMVSLDPAVSNQDTFKQKNENNQPKLCKVLLSNGSTTKVQIKDSETIHQLVTRVLDKRGLRYSSFDVLTDKHSKCLDVNEPSAKLAGCEVTIVQRVVFKLDLPNRRTISIKSKYTKIIIDVLRPTLHKYQFNVDDILVWNGNMLVDLQLPVTSIDGLRLNVQLQEDFNLGNSVKRVNNGRVSKLEERTNKIFEGILQEKADLATFKPPKSERGSVKSEDWGSVHSSTFISKILRRDSGIHDRKKKLTRCKGNSYSSNGDAGSDHQNQTKKPLIAKLKAGANKLHVTCSESDELVEGLTRAQRCRLEDQRGTKINFELPDFLKDKETEQLHNPLMLALKKSDPGNSTRFYLGDLASHPKLERIPVVASAKNLKLELQSNYENRNVSGSNNYSPDKNSQSDVSNVRTMTPTKSSEDSSSNQSTPSKGGGLNETVIENKTSRMLNDPPPLPPKPKIVPIKPTNWGQLFLEQQSSSFV